MVIFRKATQPLCHFSTHLIVKTSIKIAIKLNEDIKDSSTYLLNIHAHVHEKINLIVIFFSDTYSMEMSRVS